MFKIKVTMVALLFVFTGFVFAQQDTTEIAYDNGPGGGGISIGQGEELAVRMTPSNYPVTLLKIRVYCTNGTHPHANSIQYSVWIDPDGLDGGPVNQVIPYTDHNVNRPGFEDIDLTAHNVVIESGDFYCAIRQPTTLGLGVDYDQGIPSARRSWFYDDGIGYGTPAGWHEIADFLNFPFNLVIRAIVVSDQATAVNEEHTLIPSDYVLEQNYPNPFNPETNIRFFIPNSQHVAITIYNPLGQAIRRLVSQQFAAGAHFIKWDGQNDVDSNVASGVYLYKIQAGEFVATRKMMLIR